MGRKKDGSTAGLAQMNLILHDYAGAVIHPGQSTLAAPFFTEGEALKTFDYVVANPPFSDKRWSTGMDPNELRPAAVIGTESSDTVNFHRFDGFGVPPPKQGDYGYLLHIIKSLKSTGKAACILPHGVLFRGNAEGEIRKNLIQRGLIKAIIGLPANLFYGTGIPACIILIDKENAAARNGIFMIDASRGFMKDGPKNRLREMDIHRIVDVFRRSRDVAKYARMVSRNEIEKNEFNLNLPRYIDSQPPEDLQDIAAHLKGGIPERDVTALKAYWSVCPQLKAVLFKPNRAGYVDLAVRPQSIRAAIHDHPEFSAFTEGLSAHFEAWRAQQTDRLNALDAGFHPKALIAELAEGLLKHYEGRPLLDAYDIYQHLMNYWDDVMQDDAYLIAADGWKAETTRVIDPKTNKDRGWTCDLVPKGLIVARYFAEEQAEIEALHAKVEALGAELAALEEEHGSEDGLFSELLGEDGAISPTIANVKARLKEIKGDQTAAEEIKALNTWLALSDTEKEAKRKAKSLNEVLDEKSYAMYPTLSKAEVKTLVIDDKWMANLEARIGGEIARVEQALARRITVLSDRYGATLMVLTDRAASLEKTVAEHLKKMGHG
ncbi:N-6 DNA methylase [Mesorhizobium sp. B2-4-13]|uniref:N-6 DNA methylase n=1 Tax=Mesorhizobium sp. B2-4-13 TaxID=2589936 RepID=UPI002484A285|nr:N-6 DNA methylase [Mesorhizobium sp. B2-4-13]